jgi:DNA-binding response OmpR family regulator
MNRILVIDQDRTAREALGLACLAQGVGVAMADNVCEGARVLRFGPRDSATLFERVAPGVPVVVMVRPDADLSRVVALELAGFRVLTKPVAVLDVFAKVMTGGERARR